MTRHSMLMMVLVALPAVQSGCNRTPLPGSEEGQPTPDLPGDGDPGDGDLGDGDLGDGDLGDGDGELGDGDGDPGCAEDEIGCEGVCTNPMYDTNNCGQCGRTCVEGTGDLIEGGCFQGDCLPLYSECVLESDGFGTCGEFCQSKGETCRDDDDILRCGSVALGWYADQLESCENHVSWVNLHQIVTNCEDPLPFGFDDITYFTCCCSQTAQLP